jgi:hypothetical protein
MPSVRRDRRAPLILIGARGMNARGRLDRFAKGYWEQGPLFGGIR